MSGIPCHTDLHPGRNVYLTSWFILSVLFLTDGQMSVVPTHVGILDMCRDHRCLIACLKEHRQNEPAGQVDVPTRVQVCVSGDSGHVY